jgi:hypothetical protein
VFEIQNELVRRFSDDLAQAGLPVSDSFDDTLAKTYSKLNDQQRLMHGLIRAYTMYAMRPINLSIIKWFDYDNYFKAQRKKGSAAIFREQLQNLEAHLLLWRAKYDYWIPDKPERAIVYMDDENSHGLGFPKGIDDLIAKQIE